MRTNQFKFTGVEEIFALKVGLPEHRFVDRSREVEDGFLVEIDEVLDDDVHASRCYVVHTVSLLADHRSEALAEVRVGHQVEN